MSDKSASRQSGKTSNGTTKVLFAGRDGCTFSDPQKAAILLARAQKGR